MQHTLAVLVLTLWLLSDATGSDMNYDLECPAWKEEIKRIQSDEPRVNVTCEVNTGCTGINCNGVYTYEGSFVSGKYEKKICFGLWMDPCSNPTKLTVYIEQRSDNISFQHTVTANENGGHDEVEIPGAVESLEGLGQAAKVTVILVTDFKSEMHDNRNYVEVGIQLKPKVTFLGGLYTDYPEDFQVWLVKDVGVPVPPCDSTVQLPTHQAHTCPTITEENLRKYRPDAPVDLKVIKTGSDFAVISWTPAPPKEGVPAEFFTVHYTTGKDEKSTMFRASPGVVSGLKINTTYTIFAIASNVGGSSNRSPSVMATTHMESEDAGTLFKTCNPKGYILETCGDNQHCNVDARRCLCIPGVSQLNSGLTACVNMDPETSTDDFAWLTDMYEPDLPGGSRKNILPAALGSSLAVIVVIVLAVVVILYYRKKRARYSQHTLLRNEDDTADDGDVPPITP